MTLLRENNLIGRNCTGFRVQGGGCQCLLPGIRTVVMNQRYWPPDWRCDGIYYAKIAKWPYSCRAEAALRLGAGCLFLLLAGLVLRHYQRRHYSDPLGTLVGSINSFSEDPRVTAPVADMVARSP